MSLLIVNDHDFAKGLVEFGESVAADYAELPPLPGDGFRWRLVVQINRSAVHYRWVAEPCEVKS